MRSWRSSSERSLSMKRRRKKTPRKTHSRAFWKATLISANSSTLRKLQVPFDDALHLDYAKFSTLVELTINASIGIPAEGTDVVGRNSSKFLDSLSKSPSLHTISFHPARFHLEYEHFIFPSTYLRSEGELRKPISTLRTIRFVDDVSLDRCNSVLSGPFAEHLNELVVPSELNAPGADTQMRNKLKAIVGMCEPKGIEVVLRSLVTSRSTA
ncbi:hypothetical protein JCM5350_001362 [Sporobolomyces pararoseus]